MSNLLQANKTSVENEARGIANSVNRVIQGKFPPELMDKYLECLSCQLDYSIAVSKKACKSTETIMNKYKLSVNGNVMVADVFSSYFILQKAKKDLLNIERSFDTYEKNNEFIRQMKDLYHQVVRMLTRK